MVFQVAGKVFEEEFAKRHGPQPTSKGARHVLARNWPIARSDLRDLQFGGILILEQIDVRYLLLADSLFRSVSGSPHSFANWKYFSLDSFFFSLTEN